MKIFFSFFLAVFFCVGGLLSLPSFSAAANEIDLMVDFPSDGNEGTKIKLSEGEGANAKKGALYIMEQYVSKVFVFGAGLVSVIAVLWIIVGGYEIMFAGAGSGEISAGKEKITKAILGLVLVFLSALILHTINPGFFVI